jgi:hypothetical protein
MQGLLLRSTAARPQLDKQVLADVPAAGPFQPVVLQLL